MKLHRLMTPVAVAVATLALPVSASADGSWIQPVPAPAIPAADYEARPGILYLPLDGVTVNPSPCKDGTTQANSAKDCTPVVAAETTFPAWGDAQAQTDLLAALDTALADFNVRITTERPDDYVPYHMLIMSDTADDMSMNEVCAFAGVNCDGLPRNRVGLTLASTMACTDPDPVATALYAFGRLSGLETTGSVADPMGVPQDTMTPPATYEDACNVITADPTQCASYIHENHCATAGEQNSYQELLGVYGARVDDTTAPVIDSIAPADGTVFQATDAWTVTAKASDDSGYLVARWDWLEGIPAGLEDSYNCGATNRACPVEFETSQGANADTPWDFFGAPNGAPAGTYKFRFTAQDMAGNETSQEITFTVEGGATSGGSTSTSTSTTTGGSTSTGGATDTDASASDSDSSGGGSGGGGGCRVDGTPAAPLGLLALFGIGAIVRRRR